MPVRFTNEEKLDAIRSQLEGKTVDLLEDIQKTVFIVCDDTAEAAAFMTAYVVPSIVGLTSTYAFLQARLVELPSGGAINVELVRKQVQKAVDKAYSDAKGASVAELDKVAERNTMWSKGR